MKSIMKKILYLISASLLMLVAACHEIEVEETGINFSPDKVMQVDLAAQEVTVTIESGDSWTLTGEYDWVTPSARSGKSGDKVTFTLALNTTGKIRAAVYEINTEKFTEKLVIKQIGDKIDTSIELALSDYDETSLTVSMNVTADDLGIFEKWGLSYSETELPEEGSRKHPERAAERG